MALRRQEQVRPNGPPSIRVPSSFQEKLSEEPDAPQAKKRTEKAPKELPSLAIWATMEQAGKHVGVSARTIQRWVVERGCPAAQIGGTTRIDLQMLDEWLREEALRVSKARRYHHLHGN